MRTLFIYIFFFISLGSVAQQGMSIGSNTIHNSAILDMSKSTKGFLLPRLTQTARLGISNPADGLLVYDSTSHRVYQYQDGTWRYLLNHTYWTKSNSGNYIYSFDSIGISTSSPDARLEVNGNIRGRTQLLAEGNVSAGNVLEGDDLHASGNVVASGSAYIGGNITSQGNTTIDNASPIIQLKNGGDNKVFMQTTGDDLRFGTNSGNTTGKTIIRMNGTDIMSIDTSGGIRVLTAGGGNLRLGVKLTRFMTGRDNMLPEVYGKVYDNNNGAWMSEDGTITRTSTGVYEIQPYAARAGARSSVVVSVAGTAPLIASAVETSYKFTVRITNALTGAPADADFSFIIMDPRNLFNE